MSDGSFVVLRSDKTRSAVVRCSACGLMTSGKRWVSCLVHEECLDNLKNDIADIIHASGGPELPPHVMSIMHRVAGLLDSLKGINDDT